ncbi:MAG: hypothetical protein OXE43_05630 [Chloroflexi bacterium]|nr:hypothetical protein [Chloroflexota bacterium]
MTEYRPLREGPGKGTTRLRRAARRGSQDNGGVRGGRLVLIMVVGAAAFVLVFQVLSIVE